MMKPLGLPTLKTGALCVALAVLCAGCGNKGPLVMPSKPADAAVVAAPMQATEALETPETPQPHEQAPVQQTGNPGIRD